MMDSMPPPPANEVSHTSGARNNSNTTAPLRLPEQGLRCPRCDSANTKFCYFNNYSLTQPRHFCKTCRRYWTKGGALRNVPVGGGCRKSKKSKSSSGASLSSSSTSPTSRIHLDPFDPMMLSLTADHHNSIKFFNGLSTAAASPSIDFQLGLLPFSTGNQFISYGEFSPAAAAAASASGGGNSMMAGFNNYQLAASAVGVYSEMGGAGSMNCDSTGTDTNHVSLASSIESLSSINQDLHWKLQQQRLALFFGGGRGKESSSSSSLPPLPSPLGRDEQQQEPISFQVTDSSRADDDDDQVCGNSAGPTNTAVTTAWFLEGSCTTTIPTYANNPNNNNNNNNSSSIVNSWSGGVPTWNNMHQFTPLP